MLVKPGQQRLKVVDMMMLIRALEDVEERKSLKPGIFFCIHQVFFGYIFP
jgi:hypothetical protein